MCMLETTVTIHIHSYAACTLSPAKKPKPVGSFITLADGGDKESSPGPEAQPVITNAPPTPLPPPQLVTTTTPPTPLPPPQPVTTTAPPTQSPSTQPVDITAPTTQPPSTHPMGTTAPSTQLPLPHDVLSNYQESETDTFLSQLFDSG